MICTAIGENITGGYWERVDGNHGLSLIHNKSKPLSHNHREATLQMNITRARPTHSGRYRCVIFNPWGVGKSRNVQVTIRSKDKYIIADIWLYLVNESHCVLVAPPVITIQPSSTSVTALREFRLTCKASGFRVQYQWRRHKLNRVIGNKSNFTISEANPLTDSDQYYCIATTEGGYAFSNNATVRVNGKACVTFS